MLFLSRRGGPGAGAGSLLSALPEIVLGRMHPERALFAFAGSWYAVGPAVVFALFDPGAPSWADSV